MPEDETNTTLNKDTQDSKLNEEIAEKIEQHKNASFKQNNYAVVTELDTSKITKQIYVLARLGLLFAFVFPPLGFILAAVAENKSIKIDQKKRGLIYLVLVISSLLTIVLIGIAVVFFNNYLKETLKTNQTETKTQQTQSKTQVSSSRTQDENAAVDTTNKFLTYIKSENYAAAFELLGPELKKEYPGGADQFGKEVSAANLKLINTWDINKVSSNDKKDRIDISGSVTFNATSTNGALSFNYYKDTDGSIKMNSWQITAL